MFAIVCFGIAFGVRTLFSPELAARAIYVTYSPAVMLAAVYGGFFPGLLVAFLSALAVAFWSEPQGSILLTNHADWLGVCMFLGTSLLIALMAELMHRSRRLATQSETRRMQAEERARAAEERRYFQEQLEESERKYRIVAENTFAWEFWLSPEETFIYSSPSCQNITGYSPEEFAQTPDLLVQIIHPDDRAAYLEHRGPLPRQGCVSASVDFRIIRRDGAVRWLAHSCNPIHDENGRYLGIRGSNRDITEKKQAEFEVLQIKERLEEFIRAAPVSLAMLDREMRYVRVSNRWLHDFRLADRDIVGRLHYELFPDLPEHWRDAHRRGLAGKMVSGEEEWLAPDGVLRTYKWGVHPWGNSGVRTGGIILFTEDITQSRRDEEALRESEEKFRSVFEQAAIGIGRVNFVDARWIDVNESFCRMLGYTCEEMLQIPWTKMTHPEDLHLDLVHFERMASGELDNYTVEKRFLHKDGHTVWARLTLSLVRDAHGQPEYEIAIIEDIGERKKAEEELHRSQEEAQQRAREVEERERLLHAMMENVPLGIALADAPDMNIRMVSRFGREMFKVTGRESEASGEGEQWSIFHTDGVTLAREEELPLVRAIKHGEFIQGEEWVIGRLDGIRVPVLCTAAPTRDARGEIVGGVIGWQDLTERKRAEQALLVSEEKFAKAFALNPAAIVLARLSDGVILDANETWFSLLGYTREEVIGRSSLDLTAWPTPQSRQRYVEDLLENGSIHGREEMFLKKSGEPIVTLLSAEMLDLGGDVTALSVFLDITDRKRAEERLRERERRLSAFFHSDMVGNIYWNMDGQITDANEKFLRMLGYTREDLRSGALNWIEMTPPEYLALDEKALVQLKETGVDAPYEKEFLRKDGTRVPIIIGAAMLDDARYEGLAFVMDITESKKAQTELARSQTMLAEAEKLSRTGAWEWDVQSDLWSFSDGWLAIHGTSKRQLPSSELLPIAHPDDREIIEQAFESVRRGLAPYDIEHRIIRQDTGELRIVRSHGQYTLDPHGAVTRIYGFVQDITELKEAVEKLKQNEQRLLQANEQLAEADRRKNEFLAMLAHELRNPLAPIRSSIEMLRLKGPKDPQLQRHRETIDRQSRHMARLLDDLLDVSRVTRGNITLKKEPLDLSIALEQAFETARPLIEERKQHFLFKVPDQELIVEGDLDRLAQVFGNLLTNSSKYTPEGGQIWMQAAREDNQIVVRVGDTGMGIAPELLPHIFDIFIQAKHAGAMSQGGLGIGLTMVRNIVQMHGGAVEAYSEGSGMGSEFVVHLPVLESESRPAEQLQPRLLQKPAPAVEKKCGRRVLVVDDVADTAESLADLLQIWGCNVQVATDGAQALDISSRFSPELVLLDIGMPGMDGYEVARRIRAQNLGTVEHPLLVAMTGFGQTEDFEASRQAGFDKHLVKPVDLHELETLVCA